MKRNVRETARPIIFKAGWDKVITPDIKQLCGRAASLSGQAAPLHNSEVQMRRRQSCGEGEGGREGGVCMIWCAKVKLGILMHGI